MSRLTARYVVNFAYDTCQCRRIRLYKFCVWHMSEPQNMIVKILRMTHVSAAEYDCTNFAYDTCQCSRIWLYKFCVWHMSVPQNMIVQYIWEWFRIVSYDKEFSLTLFKYTQTRSSQFFFSLAYHKIQFNNFNV